MMVGKIIKIAAMWSIKKKCGNRVIIYYVYYMGVLYIKVKAIPRGSPIWRKK